MLVLVLVQTGLLDRDSARLPVDGEELAQQCLREGSPQVEDGGKDPVGVAGLEAGACARGSARSGHAGGRAGTPRSAR